MLIDMYKYLNVFNIYTNTYVCTCILACNAYECRSKYAHMYIVLIQLFIYIFLKKIVLFFKHNFNFHSRNTTTAPAYREETVFPSRELEPF